MTTSVVLLVFLQLRLRHVLNCALYLEPGNPHRLALVPTMVLGILYLQWKLNVLPRFHAATVGSPGNRLASNAAASGR